MAQLPQPMHQSSITISSVSLRRIDPTGQRVMHSGSMQARQLVATRKFSKRSPSRTRRVTPSSCVATQALTHSSQRVHLFEIEQQQVLALHQLLFEEGGERRLLHAAEKLQVHLAAGARHFRDADCDFRKARPASWRNRRP